MSFCIQENHDYCGCQNRDAHLTLSKPEVFKQLVDLSLAPNTNDNKLQGAWTDKVFEA